MSASGKQTEESLGQDNSPNPKPKSNLFAEDISKWDVSKITIFDYMFSDTDGFNSDISKSVDFVVVVVFFIYFFFIFFFLVLCFIANVFLLLMNVIVLVANRWDTSSAVSMNGMFRGSRVFNADISK